MSNNYFRFKQFTVYHDLCAMKVGTDGVLLGSLADGGQRILDIGTGTALAALMMAQRFPNALITGIDIDYDAVTQACHNVQISPFAERITIQNVDLKDFCPPIRYDSIICNPPFFEDSLNCPDYKRNIARHTNTLPYSTLFSKTASLLTEDGIFTIIIPTSCVKRIEQECAFASLYITQRIFIRTVEKKEPKRVILSMTKQMPNLIQNITQCLMNNGQHSEWYSKITEDFYL